MTDMINHPPHYTQLAGVECIQVTEQFNFCRGNAIKYLWRAGAKGEELADLRKALWYVQREITRLEGRPAAGCDNLRTVRTRGAVEQAEET